MFNKHHHTGNTDTLIGEGTRMDGNLITKAGIRIEGQVYGDIKAVGDVTIGEKAVVHSNISARHVINAGTIQGSVTCLEGLKITQSGQVFGSIQVKALEIIEGGIFQGTSKMEPKRAAEGETAHEKNKEHSPSTEKEKVHLVK